ncbi:MAG: DUF4192 family protein, partial [Jatrophihabitantaceae bacterium]
MTTTNADLPIVRVSGPADLVQTIPYLLGFHPARSLVLVGLADRRVVVTARMDLDELADGRLLPTTVAGLYRGGAERLVAVVYDDQASAGRGADLPWT